MVGAQHPQPVGQQFGERGGGPGRIPRRPPPPGEVVPGGQGLGVVGAQVLAGGGLQVLEIGAGGGDESGVAEAVSGVEENRVAVGLPQGVCGVGSQGGGVGAQNLAEGSVAFDLGPGLIQGVGAGTGRHVACGGE